ncbi:MAG: glycosyltransferase family 4 protein [Planctomycetes bacterium]|nr:glycosyltransferase family 4 protein [Planctomycetota bacterium]
MRRLKILFIITRLIHGGAQKMALSMAEQLSRRGHSVVLACGPQAGVEGSLLPLARKMNIEVIIVDGLVREEHPLKDCLAMASLYWLIDSRRFDIVHTHTSKAGILGRIAARFAGTPAIVHSSHGHVFSPGANIPGVSNRKLMTKVFWLAEKIAAGMCHRIVTLTEMEKLDWLKLGLAPASKIEVLYNAIPLEEFNPDSVSAEEKARLKSSLGLEPPQKIVTITGRLTSEKGHDYLLETIKLVAGKMPFVRLLIVGEGPERTELEKLAREYGIAQNVIFLGLRNDVKHILAISDLFVLASRYEGFGLVLLEAMAMRVPVIATGVGGVPEIIDDGVTGMLALHDRPDEFAAKITELLQNSEKADRIASAGRQIVMRDFSMDKMVDGFEKLYLELCKSKHETTTSFTGTL